MNVTNVLHGDVALRVVAGRLNAFPVDPISRVGVALDLHIFAELLAPTARPSLSSCSTSRMTRVLPSSAVEWCASAVQMSFQIPAASIGLGSPPSRVHQLGDLSVESVIDRGSRRPALSSQTVTSSRTLRSIRTISRSLTYSLKMHLRAGEMYVIRTVGFFSLSVHICWNSAHRVGARTLPTSNPF